MLRGAHTVSTLTLALAAFALSLGCGQICRCQGDMCTDCSVAAPAPPGPETGTPGAADATTESAVPDARGADADPTTDTSTPPCRDDQSCSGGASPDGAADIDAGSGHDSDVANDGGAQCITGCSRGTIACTAPDPPVGWRCSGPGINASNRFVEAGCTSLPINSIAWCCPDTFLSQCICTPGQDWTCNDNPAISSIRGTCLSDATCVCSMGFGLNPATGKCR
jgi:hypothetical protein